MLEVSDLTKIFSIREAVSGVTFRLCRGQVLGLLGPNGAGTYSTQRSMNCFACFSCTVNDEQRWLPTPRECARRCWLRQPFFTTRTF